MTANLKITSLNLQHGGGPRISKIVDYLTKTESDILVLTEFRIGKTGNALIKLLRNEGYSAFTHPEVEPNKNTVLIASKHHLENCPLNLPTGLERHLHQVKVKEFFVTGVYFPQAKGQKELMHIITEESHKGSSIFIGDYNTGERDLDEENKFFPNASAFTKMVSEVTDAWRHIHKNKREYTYYSTHGNGFRIDHALLSKDMEKDIIDCNYDHSTRTKGADLDPISDHSALTLETNINSISPIKLKGIPIE